MRTDLTDLSDFIVLSAIAIILICFGLAIMQDAKKSDQDFKNPQVQQVVVKEGCEYFRHYIGPAGNYGFVDAHKGNCTNSIHKIK